MYYTGRDSHQKSLKRERQPSVGFREFWDVHSKGLLLQGME